MSLTRFVQMASVIMAVYTLVMVLILFPCMRWVAFFGVLFLLRKWRRAPSDHGSATWAQTRDVLHMVQGDGLIVGVHRGKLSKLDGLKALFSRSLNAQEATERFLMAFKSRSLLLRMTTAQNLSCFAPTGKGKGAGLCIPTLLTSTANIVATDVKGELCQITADYRQNVLGHTIVRLDPFRIVTAKPDTFNVLDLIDARDPEAIDRCRQLSEALFEKNPHERDPHWQEKAQLYICGAICSVIFFCPAGQRSLQQVAEIMANSTLLDCAIAGLKNSSEHGGMLSRIGHEMDSSIDKERSGIVSTACRALNFLSTVAVAESTGSNTSFDPRELSIDGKMSIYLILPVKYMRSHGSVMKLWITALTSLLIERGINRGPSVNMLLDECAMLGNLPVLHDLLSVGRGFNIKLTAIFQSLAQLKTVFPDGQDGLLLANTSQIFFGVSDQVTAEYCSNRLGSGTIATSSGGVSYGTSRQQTSQSQSSNYSDNWSLTGRKLLLPEEVAGLHERVALVFSPNCPPLWTHLVRYYERGFKPNASSKFWMFVVTTFLFIGSLIPALTLTAVLVSHLSRR